MPRTYKRKGLRVSRGKCGINKDRESLRLYVRHEGKAYYWGEGWRAGNPIHEQRLKELQAQIDYDILRGQFDPTWKKYGKKPRYSASKPQIGNISALWEAYKRGNTEAAQTTRENYWCMVDAALRKPETKKVAESGLDSADCRTFKVRLLADYSDTTAKRVLQCLRAAWNWCYKINLIDKKDNPFSELQAEIKPPKSTRSCEAFTAQEQEAILIAFNCEKISYLPFVEFLFLTGCRPEEACGLTWGQIKDGFIVFDRAYSKGYSKDTKTGESRIFPVVGALSVLLNSQWEKQGYINAEPAPEKLVFPHPKYGYPIDLANFTQKHWNPIQGKLSSEGKLRQKLPTYHCRHTFISRQIRAGIDTATIAKWCGNSALTIARHYAAADPDAKPV
jgi:integrase